MKKILLPVLLVFLASCGAKTNEKENPVFTGTDEHHFDKPDYAYNQTKEKSHRNISDFIPKGYVLLDSASANLNLDGSRDLILVLHKPDEEKTSDVVNHPERRPLLILTGNPDKTYSLAARNDNTILCVNCGGMMGEPFEGISIENEGTFTLLHYGGSSWRWSKNLTYTWSKREKTWLLQEISEDSYHSSDPEKAEIKVSTPKNFGKVTFEEFDIYEE